MSDAILYDVVVIVVTHNSSGVIRATLESIHESCRELRHHVVVVDTNSKDNLGSYLDGDPRISFLGLSENVGYAAAINHAIVVAPPSTYRFLVNPDVIIDPSAVKQLLLACRDSDTASVPRLLRNDGTLWYSIRRNPTILSEFGESIFGDHWPQRPRWLANTERDPERYRSAVSVDWATGAALFMPSGLWDRVGRWDESFFLYSEELDFMARARRAGAKIVFQPGAVVWHAQGGSGANPDLEALLSVNRSIYYERSASRLRGLTFRCCAALRHLIRLWREGDRLALRSMIRPRASRGRLIERLKA